MTEESNQEPGTQRDDVPDPRLAELIGPLLAGVAEADRPVVIAMAERIAADRYRAWAVEVDDPLDKARLIACAARERHCGGAPPPRSL